MVNQTTNQTPLKCYKNSCLHSNGYTIAVISNRLIGLSLTTTTTTIIIIIIVYVIDVVSEGGNSPRYDHFRRREN